MTAHPLDGLVDSILDRARSRGLLESLPAMRDVFSGAAGAQEMPAASPTLGYDPLVVLSEMIATAEQELAWLRGTRSRAAKVAEIGDLRLRLAAEIQALRPRW